MKVKVTVPQMNEISAVLVFLEQLITDYFIRKTRILDELLQYKGTEFRILLQYVLPDVLENRIPNIVYQHFMLLHVAIRILSCKVSVTNPTYVDYAEALSRTYVIQAP